MLATYQDPNKSIYGSVYGYATPQVVQPQMVQQQVAQPQIVNPQMMTPSIMQAPQLQRPVAMAQPPAPGMATEFPYMAMQVIGGFQIAIAIVILGLGIGGVVIDPMNAQGLLGIFGLVSICVTMPMSLIHGVIGILHNRSTGQLESFRNTFMVLGSMLVIYCIFAIAIFTYLLLAVNVAAVFGGGAPPGMEIYNGVYSALLVFTALTALMGLAGASVGCCCAPRCCSPLVDQGDYSFVYRREMNMKYPAMGYQARPQMY